MEEEEENEFEETDSDQSEDDESSQQIPSWSEDQLELLESALSSYKFLPRTTTEKVYTELKERNSSSPCTRRMVRSWFSNKEVVTSSARDRWEARLEKLATCDHAAGSLAKTERRVRFCQEVQVKNVEEKSDQDFDKTGLVQKSGS